MKIIFFGKNINSINLNFKVTWIINIELFVFNNKINFHEWHEYEYKLFTNMFYYANFTNNTIISMILLVLFSFVTSFIVITVV